MRVFLATIAFYLLFLEVRRYLIPVYIYFYLKKKFSIIYQWCIDVIECQASECIKRLAEMQLMPTLYH